MAGNWTVDLPTDEYDHPADCPECTARNQVAEAGARTLVAQIGVDFDTLTDHEKQHYADMAAVVYTAMSAAMIETGLAREVTND